MFGTSLRSPLPSLKLPAGELLECVEQFVPFARIGLVSFFEPIEESGGVPGNSLRPARTRKTPCVCFEVQTGKHLLGLNLTAFDP